jgi:phenylalanyl-tRNA synthetase beta chain
MQRAPSPVAKVRNPVTEDTTLLRPTLLPGLMTILKKNAHRDLPQRLFEVGMVTRLDGDAVHNERHVAGVLIAGRSNFSEVKGIVLALARDLGWTGEVAKAEDAAFVPGRCASYGGRGDGSPGKAADQQIRGVVQDGSPGKAADQQIRGVFGEVHPAVLDAFGLAHPVVAFELTLARGPGDAVRDARE